MAAGVSTPSLRAIARRGVNITKAAHSELTMPLILGSPEVPFLLFFFLRFWVP